MSALRCYMKLSLIFVLLFLPAVATAGGGEAWTRVAAKNFILVGNANEKEIR